MTHHSEPAREAVARALHEHFGTSSTTMFTAREAGRQAASVVLRHLPASPAPAAGGLEAVRALPYLIHLVRQRWEGQWTYTVEQAIERWLSGEFHNDAAESDAKAAALASPAATSAETQGGDGVREAVRAALEAELGDAYDCLRVWEAWHAGTMTEDDFTPVCDRLDDIVATIIAALAPSTSAATRGEPVAWHDLHLHPPKGHPAPAVESAQVKEGRSDG